jgi:mono/diheme cytochrome c family protein
MPAEFSLRWAKHRRKTTLVCEFAPSLRGTVIALSSLKGLNPDLSVPKRKLEAMMIVSFANLKNLAFMLAAVLAAATFLIASVPARTTTDDDAAALYKSKCFACHGATAEKNFDATKTDDDLIQTVLKGKKLEKPPNMPSFEERGITADQAKALVAFMKSQKH